MDPVLRPVDASGGSHALDANPLPRPSRLLAVQASSATAPRSRGQRARAMLTALRLCGVVMAGSTMLTACGWLGPPPILRGNRVSPDLLKEITPGVTTRQDVQALIGSPTAASSFDNDRTWYYISSFTQLRPGRALAVYDQRVIAVNFTDQGVVQDVHEVKPDEMRNQAMVARTTPVAGSDRSLLQSLFGSVGRVGVGGMSNNNQSPGVQ